MNKYRVFANVICVFHWLWILLLLVGLFFQASCDLYKTIYFVILLTTGASQILFMGCPLVALENYFWRKYDPSKTYSGGGFTCHYLNKWLNIEISPWIITAILVALILISILIAIFNRQVLLYVFEI